MCILQNAEWRFALSSISWEKIDFPVTLEKHIVFQDALLISIGYSTFCKMAGQINIVQFTDNSFAGTYSLFA